MVVVSFLDAAPVAVFQLGIVLLIVMWLCLYTIPAAQDVYNFTVSYESALMSAVALGLFLHAIMAIDMYVVPIAAAAASVMAWIQIGMTLSWYGNTNGNANQNGYRNVTTNPYPGATQAQFNSQIAFVVLNAAFVTEMLAYWVYLFWFKSRNMCGEMQQLESPHSDQYDRLMLGEMRSRYHLDTNAWVAQMYWKDTKANLGFNMYTLHLVCVVGFSCIVLGMFVVSVSANVAQMYLGPIANTQFGNVLGVYMMVRPLGPYPCTKKPFYGFKIRWIVTMIVHGFGVGVSAANLWIRSEYVMNQANRIDSIVDKANCVLSLPCYQILSASTTFYEYGVTVAYTTSVSGPAAWATWSLVSFQLELSAFVFGAVILFVRAYWIIVE